MRRFVSIVLSSTFILQAAPLMAAPPVRAARAAQVQASTTATTGGIYGTAVSSSSKALSGFKVQVRDLATGELAGTTTSDDRGRFSFAGLGPGNYSVEIVSQTGAIVGTSAPVAVAAGATATVAVATTAIVSSVAGAAGGGISTALLVTTIAAAAGIAGAVVVLKDASGSE